MDDTVTRLFEGKQAPEVGPERCKIIKMLKDGTWIDPSYFDTNYWFQYKNKTRDTISIYLRPLESVAL